MHWDDAGRRRRHMSLHIFSPGHICCAEEKETGGNMSLALDVECGDILLFARNCSRMPPLPAAICVSAKYSSWTIWDHVGIVVEHPETGELHLMEANIQGITVYPLLDRIKRTSASQIAIRKLHRNVDDNIDFRQLLWDTVQKYLKFQYNSSFAHMTAAAYASYTSHLSTYAKFHDKLFTLKQELDYIYAYLDQEEDVNRAKNEGEHMEFASQFDASQSRSTSLLSRYLSKRADNLVAEIESTENIFQKLVQLRQSMQPMAISPVKSALSIDKTSKNKERFYCSQLVAQVFMDIGVLSRIHRQAHEYVPADFSSSTMIQGLLPLNHGPDHDYHERHYHPDAEAGKKPRYFFSPDYVITSPNTAVFLPKNVDIENETKLKNNKITVLVSDPAISTNNISSQTSITLSLHTGDTIRSSILSQYLQTKENSILSPGKHLMNVEIEGEVLLKPVLDSSVPTTEILVPPTVILSSSLSSKTTAKSSYAATLKKKLLDSISMHDIKEKVDIIESDNLSDKAYMTQVSNVCKQASSSETRSQNAVEYDDDSLLSTMRAYDHYQTGAYELLALKASKVRFIYETRKLGLPTNNANEPWANCEDNTRIILLDQQRVHEHKILRWKYIESLISLAWPIYHASLIKTKEDVNSKDIHSFDNDSEALAAMWQELSASLPPLEMSSPQQILAKQRMVFAFSCFWDDSVRHLKLLSTKKNQETSTLDLKKSKKDMEEEEFSNQSQLLKETASDLADMLLHLYTQHYSAIQSPNSVSSSANWTDNEQNELQFAQRQRAIASKIEYLLPRFMSSTPASISFSDSNNSSGRSSFFNLSIWMLVLSLSTSAPMYPKKTSYSSSHNRRANYSQDITTKSVKNYSPPQNFPFVIASGHHNSCSTPTRLYKWKLPIRSGKIFYSSLSHSVGYIFRRFLK